MKDWKKMTFLQKFYLWLLLNILVFLVANFIPTMAEVIFKKPILTFPFPGFATWILIIFNAAFAWFFHQQKLHFENAEPINTERFGARLFNRSNHPYPFAYETLDVIQIPKIYVEADVYETAAWEAFHKSHVNEVGQVKGKTGFLIFVIVIGSIIISRNYPDLGLVGTIFGTLLFVVIGFKKQKEAILQADKFLIPNEETKQMVLHLLRFQLDWYRNRGSGLLFKPVKSMEERIAQVEAIKFSD